MALQKEVDYRGIVCNYHKVLGMNVEFRVDPPGSNGYSKVDIIVGLYKDAAHRVGGVDNALRTKQYHYLKSDTGAPTKAELDEVYDALKLLPEFNGAVDV